MGGDERLDRRGFVQRAGGAVAGVLGVSGVGSAREGSAGRAEQASDPDEGITRFRMVLPAVEPLEITYVNVVVIAGLPIGRGERPPPACIPEGEDQWRAYNAVVADLTESSLLGGDGNELGELARTRAYAARSLRPGTPYRVVGGTACDGHVRVTVHELADELEASLGPDETGGNGGG